MSRFAIGDKVMVVVEGDSRKGWSEAALAVMNGLVGVIEEVSETHNNGREVIPMPGGTKYLVRFHAHNRGHWHSNAYHKNVDAFHFTANELERIRG